MNTRQVWQRFDFLLFAVVLILCIFGIALISTAIGENHPTLGEHPQRQTTFLIIGLVVLFIVSAFDYHIWMTFESVLCLRLFLLVLTFDGSGTIGAARWLKPVWSRFNRRSFENCLDIVAGEFLLAKY